MQDLKTTEMMKYLGVIISQDLSWDTHITNITKKANQTLGFLRRNLKVGSVSIKKRGTKPSSDHAVLEYASPVWDPYTAKDIARPS